MRFLSLVTTILCTLVFIAQSKAQYSHFLDTPTLVSKDLDTFKQLYQSASSEGLRIAMFGDSQETSNGGAGKVYVPSVNLEYNRHYGNTPESNVAFGRSYADEWLLAGSNVGATSTQRSGSDLLPSQWVGRFGNANPAGGLLAQLNLDASNTPFANSESLEFNSQNVEVQIIGRGFQGSSEINWRVNVNSSDQASYYGGTNVASGVTSMNLGNSGTGQYQTQSLGVYSLPEGNRAIQVIARADTASEAEVAGVRFINADNPAGVSVQSFSRGGYRAFDLYNNHGDAEDAFRAFGEFDALMLHFGANDALYSTAEEFEEDLQQLIDRYREWSNSPALPVVIMADPDFDNLSEFQRGEFDLYAGVAASLALSNENVLALNGRRLAHEQGWYVGSPEFDSFVHDGVHYTTEGAQTLARIETAALLSLTQVPEPGSACLLLLAAVTLIVPRRRSA